MTGTLSRYTALTVAGELRRDQNQADAAALLDHCQTALESAPRKGSVLWRMVGRKADAVRGVYMWGGVGRGKTMLMDLFYASLAITRKRRVHFHAFMLDVHARLREERKRESGDPIGPVAAALAEDVRCLCFDEMVINNSADAMIMSRLFTALIVQHGVTIVATSNRPPGDLYKDGLNREHFLPFIALINERLDVVALNGPTDYRRDRLSGVARWHVPNGAAATAALSEAFFRLTDYPPEDKAHVPTATLDVGAGRTLHVPKSLKGVAVFSFKRLCGEARGAADYLSIARSYHSVIIVGIPVMGPDQRNEAARFVTLIDALYDHRVKLLASADAWPDALYTDGDGSFEFARTASRLSEMLSDDWLSLPHGHAA
ncbi:MAG: cell division protein ZapE [Sphingopyxis sp.]|nr:cell division protein ZapE [Sphingopyxis sp.]